MSKLVIAEKPSVAMSIAKVIGATKRNDGYMEGNGYIVSWCVGHLVSLAVPEEYDGRYEIWKKEDLPILPGENTDDWKYQVSRSTKKQFNILKALTKRVDVTSIVNACDAGREGELIFRLVYEKAGCKKPMERLWISSMEDKAILDGFNTLRKGSDYDRLYEAALCRERADWLIGMNCTRFFTTIYKQTLNIGRVMTPTLAMVAEREAKKRAFKSEPFYVVEADVDGMIMTSERFSTKEEAEDYLHECELDKKIYITEYEAKEVVENPPLLYDLTTLQRDANKRYGYTAQQTLDYAQSLYEKKLITYPRTDSKYLTDDMESTLLNILQAAKDELDIDEAVSDIRRTINGSKVTDHHAIIPTMTISDADFDALPAGERNILKSIMVRIMQAVSSPAIYEERMVEGTMAGRNVTAKGKSLIDPGFKKIAFDDSEKPEKKIVIHECTKEEILEPDSVKIKSGKTTPPKSYTEDTLLSAMENAGDSEQKFERRGIGTPATRAAIIEKLVKVGFIERMGTGKTKYLNVTPKGEALITVVPEEIQSPSMTTDWEEKLLEIEQGTFTSQQFMEEISDMIKNLVETYEPVKDARVLFPKREYKGR